MLFAWKVKNNRNQDVTVNAKTDLKSNLLKDVQPYDWALLAFCFGNW